MLISDLNTCDRATFVGALGPLFEHSPWVTEAAFERRPFRDARHLHEELCAAMHGAAAERRLELIRAHPDLGVRMARQSALTPESEREQASAGLDTLSSAALAELGGLNHAYRERFGFPFILCARLNSTETILAALHARLGNTPEEEHATALAEIEMIAWLRLEDTLTQDKRTE